MILVAIRMLVGARAKFLGVVGGVVLAAFLMTHFQAILAGMMTRTFAMLDDTPGVEVWVMDPAVEYVDEVAALPAPALDRVRGVPGVEWATRLYTGSLRARLAGGRFRSVQVVGVDDASLVGLPATLVAGSVDDLRRPDAVLIDEASTKTLLRPAVGGGWGVGRGGPADAPTRPLGVGDELTINDRRVVVAGIVAIRPRFLAKGTLFTTYSRALALAPPERNLTSFVVVRAQPGQDPAALARRIEASTGLRARTRAEFARDTVLYYVRNTDVVGQVGLMTLIAAGVGTSITALLLSMVTSDGLRFYATFAAIGATGRTLLAMVAAQAVVSGLLGLGLGLGLSVALGRAMAFVGMPYRLMPWSLGVTSLMVVGVCAAAAVFSARKVLRVEPAIVFKT